MQLNYYINSVYLILNIIRLNPHEYALKTNLNYICTPKNMNILYLNKQLLRASEIKIEQLKDQECLNVPIHQLHDTCFKYCYLYHSCSYIDRITYYCPNCHDVAENIIAYKKSPIKAIHTFLEESMGHCENIFNSEINSIGVAGDGKPWYLQTFAFNLDYVYDSFDTICSYFWKNETIILTICLAKSIDELNQIYINDIFLQFQPLFPYYTFYNETFIENNNFTLNYNDQTIKNIDEKFFYIFD